MKRLSILTSLLAFILVNIPQANAQWTKLGDFSTQFPDGIASLGMAYDNGTLYSVGTGFEGIYKSTDDGKTWTVINKTKNGLPNSGAINYSDIEIFGDYIYVSQTSNLNGDMYYSKDDGDSWTVDSAGLPKSPLGRGRQHVVDLFSHNGYVFVQLEVANSYYRKLPTDAAWTKMPWKSGQNAFLSLGDTLFAIMGTGVGYSTDNGDTWVSAGNKGVTDIATSVAGLSAVNGVLYMGGVDWTKYPNTNKGVMKSTDKGENWSLVGFEETGPAMTKVLSNGTDMVMLSTGSPSMVLHSSDNGSTHSWDTAGIKGDWGKLYVFNGKFYLATTAGAFMRGKASSGIAKTTTKHLIQSGPNPFEDQIQITTAHANGLVVNLININGQIVQSARSNSTSAVLHTSDIAPGIYFLETIDSQSGLRTSHQKMIKGY